MNVIKDSSLGWLAAEYSELKKQTTIKKTSIGTPSLK